MSLYDQIKKSQSKAVKAGASSQVIKTLTGIDTSDAFIRKLSLAAEKAGFELNEAAIEKSGKSKLGNSSVVLFSVKRRLPTPAAVTLYWNGTLVLAGVDAGLVLKAPKAPTKAPAQLPTA